MRKKYTNEEKQILQELLQRVSSGANTTVAKLLIILGAFVLITVLLFVCGVFQITSIKFVICVLLGDACLLFAAAAIALKLKGLKKWLKYMLFIVLLLFLLTINVMLNYKCYPLYILPILLSMRYNSKRFTIEISCGVLAILLLTLIANAWLYPLLGYMDLSTVSFSAEKNIVVNGFLYNSVVAAGPDRMTILKNGLRATGIPYGLIFILLAICAVFLLNYTEGLLLALYRRMQKTSEIKLQLAESNMKLTLSQLKPHFLYNTLTSIVVLCDSDPKEAGKLTSEFASYLRGNMSAVSGTKETPFSKELEHTKVYVEIEQVRFEERLRMHYDIQETDFLLPPLTLQPIVENAIKHGIMKRMNGGNVWVRSFKEDGCFLVTVRDDGVGFDPEQYQEKRENHFGLYLVRSRIENAGGSMEIQSVLNEGTIVTIKIPENPAL